jgi:carbamoyltransferase
MNIVGINALNHGSSIAIFNDHQLKRWEFFKTDTLDQTMISDLIRSNNTDKIYWYENPWLKKTRQWYAGQYSSALDVSVLPKNYLKGVGFGYSKLIYTPHHGSHAAAGYYTSPFNNCAIIVLDAIGEWDCASIWEAKHGHIKKIWSKKYPHSLGLFYSAFTKLIGLRPVHDEHQFQKMSELGDPDRYYQDVLKYILPTIRLLKNLHKGISDWPYPIVTEQDRYDIAAAVQRAFEKNVLFVHKKAKELTGLDSLVYMGGCAMNSLANKKIVEPMWNYIWSLPMPGDPTSSIGAVLYHTKHKVWDYTWQDVKHISVRV